MLTAPTTASKYRIVKYSYDTRGMPECTAVRMNTANWDGSQGACALEAAGSNGPDRITRNLYDEVGRLKQVQSAYGVTTPTFPATLQRNEATYTFTDNGKVLTVADAKNNLTTYQYDGFDRLSKTFYPSPTTPGSSSTTDYMQAGYDANSNMTSLRLRDTQSIATTYDNLNRLTFKNLPGSEPDVTYGYDLIGRTTGASQTGYALTFTYDALSRNLTQVSSLGTVTSTWDLAGRRTRLDLPGSYYTTYDYLVTGETTAIRESGATTGPGVLATFAYDNLGRRTTLTRGNGTVTGYTFDAISRLGSVAQDLSGTAGDVTYCMGLISGSCTPSYNPASQILSRTVSNDAYAFTQQYNANRAYTANGLNQYLTAGGVTPAYDARGNMSNAGAGSIVYSAENLMTSAPGATSMLYDPALRLQQIAGSATTRFLYDGTDLVAEYDTGGNVLRRYVHGPGTDEPLIWYEGSGTTTRRWLHADERGSIIAVSDSTGTATATNRYDEWGDPQTTNQGRFQYTGQTWLAEIGMYYYKARIYNSRLGRFMQTDPIGYKGGMNLYAYATNDPVNFSDPSGLDSCIDGYANCPGGSSFDYGISNGPDIFVTGSGCTVWNGCQSLKDSYGIENLMQQLTHFDRAGNGDKEMSDNDKPQKQTQCPAVPSGGPGAGQLNRNIQEASRQRRMNAGGSWSIFAVPALEGGTGAWFAGQVKTGGAWDYKNQGYSGGRNFGNFNYGATAAALGYDWATTMGAAHAYSLIDTGGLEGESAQIRAGFMYARRGCK